MGIKGTTWFGGIIIEKLPPYTDPNSDGDLLALKKELKEIINLHFTSSHYLVPVLEEKSFGRMFRKICDKQSARHLSADESDGIPAVLKAIVFAVAALEMRHRDMKKCTTQFYFALARKYVERSPGTGSFEFLLANTLLVSPLS